MDKDDKVVTHLGDAAAKSMNNLTPIRVKTRETSRAPSSFACTELASITRAISSWSSGWKLAA